MVEFETPITLRELARKSGFALSESALRDACHRDAEHHPLPHIRTGRRRPIVKVRWSDFCQWYDEETRLTCA